LDESSSNHATGNQLFGGGGGGGSGGGGSGGGGGEGGGSYPETGTGTILPKGQRRGSAVESAYSWALMRFYTLIVKRQSIRMTQGFNKWKYTTSEMIETATNGGTGTGTGTGTSRTGTSTGGSTTAPPAPSTAPDMTFPLPDAYGGRQRLNDASSSSDSESDDDEGTNEKKTSTNPTKTTTNANLDLKYIKMIKVGLSLDVVKHKMTINGDDSNVLTNYMNQKNQPKPDLSKYYKMLQLGLPMGAVHQKMKKDGMEPSLLSAQERQGKQGNSAGRRADPATKDPGKKDPSNNPKLTKYFKMLKMGIPRGAVENKMKQDGLTPSLLSSATVPSSTPTSNKNTTSSSSNTTTTTTTTIKLKDSSKYSKYFKMLKMGIPAGAVKNKMTQDGVDPSVLDLGGNAFEPSTKALPKKATSSGVRLKDSTKYGKYFKMLKMRIPAGAVKNKMTQDGVDPSVLDLGGDAFEPTLNKKKAHTLLLKDDVKYSKYFKMLTVGLPPDAVKHRMVQDNMDPTVLDMDLNGPSPNQPQAGLLMMDSNMDSPHGRKKKKKKKKKGDGLVRKKIHWRKLAGARLEKSMWNTVLKKQKEQLQQQQEERQGLEAAQAQAGEPKNPGGEADLWFSLESREIKEMTALFCQSMTGKGSGSPGRGRDLGASKQGGRKESKLKNDNGGGRSMKKKKVTLLDMTRANNISIVLARFDDVSFTKLTRAVCSLDTMGMSSEHLRYEKKMVHGDAAAAF
jgi:hypothetical protein